MTSTSDWLHFHQANSSATGQPATPYTTASASDLIFSGRASEPTMASTTMSHTTNSPPTGPAHLVPAPGRVSKPARKRTRASRRTPTTLLNTDTTNFRAMVQQFTGGPSSNFDIPGPSPQMYGPGYGLQLPMGQLQQPVLSPLQYSMSSNNNNSNNNNNSSIMFMQRMGEGFNNNTSDGRNINVSMRLTGPGNGSSSSENRGNNSNYHF